MALVPSHNPTITAVVGFCVMASHFLFRSPALDQFMIITDRPEPRMNPGGDLLNAQEANREQREENGESGTGNWVIGRVTLKRKTAGTPPTVALRAKKIPTDTGWDLRQWWQFRI
jgi:hypothetical protein